MLEIYRESRCALGWIYEFDDLITWSDGKQGSICTCAPLRPLSHCVTSRNDLNLPLRHSFVLVYLRRQRLGPRARLAVALTRHDAVSIVLRHTTRLCNRLRPTYSVQADAAHHDWLSLAPRTELPMPVVHHVVRLGLLRALADSTMVLKIRNDWC